MLVNQGRNLTELDFSALQELRAALADSRRLLEEAKGLSFDVEQARRGYARLYPDGYGAGTSIGDMASDAQARWQQAREALRTAVELQRSEEHTSELQSLKRISYAVFCLT